MQTYSSPTATPLSAKGCTATIGNFDGVHIGHQSLISHTIQEAQKRGVPSVLITFDPHPLQVVTPDKAPPLLMNTPSKLACLDALGLDYCLVLPFTKEFATQSPDLFVESVLVDILHIQHLTIGYDYSFGKGRSGNATMLRNLGSRHGFTLTEMPAVAIDGEAVSSTAIRKALAAGHVQKAAKMLGRPHFTHGTVVHGKNRGGKLLGFPTANLQQEAHFLLPSKGVYAVLAELKPAAEELAKITPMQATPVLHGVASVGSNPTFDDKFTRVETFLFDFNQNIYGQGMRVHFIARLRDEEKFATLEALVEQIAEDVEAAKEVLQQYPFSLT